MPANFDDNVQIKVLFWDTNDALSTGGTASDISKYVRRFGTKRVQSPRLDQTQPGQARIVLDNRDGRFDPANASGAYAPNVKVNKRITLHTIESGTTYDVFSGFVTGWPQQFPGMKDNTVTVNLVDGFKHLSRFETSLTESEELSGTRIGNLLDSAGWPAAWRDLDAGNFSVQSLSSEFNTALGEIRRTELVEQGTFYMAGNGHATFRDGHTLVEDQTTPASTYGDVASGNLPISNPLQPLTNDSQLWNKATVTRNGGTAVTSTSTASVDDYGTYDLSLSNTLHVADGEAQALADFVTFEHDDPDQHRVDRITVLPQSDPTNLWVDVFTRDFLDRVRVKKQTGGDDYNEDFHVSGVTHTVDVRARKWETKFQLRPVLSSTDWWILGTSELDNDTRLFY